MNDVVFVGRHRLWQEGDVLRVEHRGPMSHTEYDAMLALLQDAVAHRGIRYYLMDLTHAGPPTPEARRRMSQSEERLDVIIVAFGASWMMRTVTAMVQRARALLGRRPSVEFQLKATEAEARAWIAEHRKAASSRPRNLAS